MYVDDLKTFLYTLSQFRGAFIARFIEFLNLRRQLHGRIYAVDELDVCASYLGNPSLFRKNILTPAAGLIFSPHEQQFFDELYFSGKLKFKEKPLPDDNYQFEST